jgi:hypothetical protein
MILFFLTMTLDDSQISFLTEKFQFMLWSSGFWHCIVLQENTDILMEQALIIYIVTVEARFVFIFLKYQSQLIAQKTITAMKTIKKF